MILNRLWRHKTFITASSTTSDALASDRDEIPRYPPSLQGLPTPSCARLLRDQQELLDRIRLTSGVGEALWARWYAPVIDHYTAHVHLLPASQSHHHRGMGGLLRHGLEVAFQSLRLLDTILVGGSEETASARRAALPRWQYAAFLVGLLHDIGKPITDMTVRDKDGQEWSPFAQSLAEWLVGRDRYYLEWRPGRRDKHVLMTALIAPRFIGAEGLAWLAGDDVGDILQLLVESLTGLEYGANKLRDIATKADAWSVQKDLVLLGTLAAPAESNDIGIPVERYILETLRRLCRENRFRINRVGGEVWYVDNVLYLVWPKAGAAAIEALKRDRMPGIPSDPDRIAQILIERGLALPAANGPYHRLMPETLRDPNGHEMALHVLRLRDAELLIDPPPSSVPGRVENGAQAAPSADTTQKTVHQVAAAPPSLSEMTADTPPPSSPAKGVPQTPGIDTTPSAVDALRALGPVGEILCAIGEDLARGKRPATFAWAVDDGLALLYPDAVTGYGMPAKDVLALCQDPEMLIVPDPVTPAKRVQTIVFGKKETRALVLRQDIAELVTRIREGDGAKTVDRSQSSPVSAPPATSTTLPEPTTVAAAPPDRDDVLRAAAAQSKMVKRRQGFLYLPLAEAIAALQSVWKVTSAEATERLADLPNGQIDNHPYLKIPEKSPT